MCVCNAGWTPNWCMISSRQILFCRMRSISSLHAVNYGQFGSIDPNSPTQGGLRPLPIWYWASQSKPNFHFDSLGRSTQTINIYGGPHMFICSSAHLLICSSAGGLGRSTQTLYQMWMTYRMTMGQPRWRFGSIDRNQHPRWMTQISLTYLSSGFGSIDRNDNQMWCASFNRVPHSRRFGSFDPNHVQNVHDLFMAVTPL